jgi:hypothetical protein
VQTRGSICSGTKYLNAASIQSATFRADILNACTNVQTFLTSDPRDTIYALIGLLPFSNADLKHLLIREGEHSSSI